MKVSITTKGLKINSKLSDHLNFHLQKISGRLPHLKPELPSLKLLVKKTLKKYHARKHYHSSFSSYSNRKTALAHFEGSISLQLPKRLLYVKFAGRSLHECIDLGIDRLKKEFQKYKQSLRFSREKLKDLHFKSQSQYPNTVV